MSSWAPVAHAYNPSYRGGRDQEDQGSKPAQANRSRDLSQNTHHKKRAGGVAQGVGPEFKPQYHKKKKKRKEKKNFHKQPASEKCYENF
jgi:hypothetical protein